MTKNKPKMKWYCVEYDLEFDLTDGHRTTEHPLVRKGICHVSVNKPELLEQKVAREGIKLMDKTTVLLPACYPSGGYCFYPEKTTRVFRQVFITRITYLPNL